MLDASPPDTNDFGFHNPYETVKLAAMFLKHWHMLPYPGGVFDQPIELLYDMIRYLNLQDSIHEARADGYNSVRAVRELLTNYEEQELYDEPVIGMKW